MFLRRIVSVAVALLFWTGTLWAACSEHTTYSGQDNWTNATTLTVHMPTGTTCSVGDIAITGLFGQGGGGGTVGLDIASAPASWTLAYGSPTGRESRLAFYYRVIDGTETATYSYTTTDVQWGGGHIVCYSGGNTSSPIDSGTTATNTCETTTASAASCTVPAPTLATAGDCVFAFAGDRVGYDCTQLNRNFSTPSGYTTRTSCASGGSNAQAGLGTFGNTAAWDQAFASAGAIAAFTSTWGVATDNTSIAEGLIAIAGAAAATATPTPTAIPSATPTPQASGCVPSAHMGRLGRGLYDNGAGCQ